jgi:hypothetical protein
MLPGRVLQFRKTEIHGEHSWLQSFLEELSLFGLTPICKVCRKGDCVFHDDVLHPILQMVSPTENALDTGRIRGNDPDGREAHSECLYVLEHGIEPLVCDLPGTGPHVRQNNRGAVVYVVNERIEAGGGVNAHFLCSSAEVMREAATRLVFCVEVEQFDRDFLTCKPFDQREHESRLADTTFSAHREDYALRSLLHWYY